MTTAASKVRNGDLPKTPVMGFTFNRSGVGIPTLAISAWIPEQTVVNDEFRATSLLATMRQRFNPGQPLSARDASARSIADIFTLTSPRAQEDWPQVTPRPVPVMLRALASRALRLTGVEALAHRGQQRGRAELVSDGFVRGSTRRYFPTPELKVNPSPGSGADRSYGPLP